MCMQKLALSYKLNSRALRAYSIGAAAQDHVPPPPQAFAQELEQFFASNTNNAPPTQHYQVGEA